MRNKKLNPVDLYRIEIAPIPEELGGGYEAYIPVIGKRAYCGWGKTPEKALKHLRKVAIDVEEMARRIRGKDLAKKESAQMDLIKLYKDYENSAIETISAGKSLGDALVAILKEFIPDIGYHASPSTLWLSSPSYQEKLTDLVNYEEIEPLDKVIMKVIKNALEDCFRKHIVYLDSFIWIDKKLASEITEALRKSIQNNEE